ncbi:MAG: copper-binding protein, partial [Pseudomonas sp.]
MAWLHASVLLLLILGGAAQAAPQPITSLPLQAEGDKRWRLPAGEYQGSFSVDQPMHILCEPGAVLQGQGQGNGLL